MLNFKEDEVSVFSFLLLDMISLQSFTLDNGLRVLVHEDRAVQIAVMNILYDVGSRDERPDKTGFAHLFEHLMFGGSVNIPSYDEPLQNVGERTMPLPARILPTIISPCLPPTSKLAFGWKATG